MTDIRVENAYDRLFPYLEEDIEKNAGTIFEEYTKDNPNKPYSANQLAKDLSIMADYGLLIKTERENKENRHLVYYYKLKI